MGIVKIERQSLPLGKASFAILEQHRGSGFNQSTNTALLKPGEGAIFRTEHDANQLPAETVLQVFSELSSLTIPLTDEELFAWIKHPANGLIIAAYKSPLHRVRQLHNKGQALITLETTNRSYDIFYGQDERNVRFFAEMINYLDDSTDQTVVRRTL